MNSSFDYCLKRPKYEWYIALPVALLIGLFVILADYCAVSTHGSASFLSLQVFVVFPVFIAFALILSCVVRMLFRRTRRTAFNSLLVCIACVAIILGSIQIGNLVRMSGFRRLAERSTPLVVAIKSYIAVHGKPPDSLQALVPEFMPSVPHTEMGAYPEYQYRVCKGLSCDGNSWMISVLTSTGVLNFDTFFYYPLLNYPDCQCGNRIERVGDWAYKHE